MRSIRLGIILMLAWAVAPAQDSAKGLRALGQDEPRTLFFRFLEGDAQAGRPAETWNANFSRMMGIIVKGHFEEGPRDRVPPYVDQFKERYPDQMALFHYNGRARRPAWRREPFFPGHWIHYEGSRVTQDVPAQAEDTVIHVVRAGNLFRMNQGRYRNQGDDVTLCELKPDGKPEWSACEEVKLVAQDPPGRTVTVRRGQHGTKPRAFAADRAWAAAHVTEGPWVPDNAANPPQLQWFYNFALDAPRDANGRSATDVLLGELTASFGPAGELRSFDGIAFDVLYWDLNGGTRVADVDGDGQPDNGMIGGRNNYGLGQNEFLRRLRESLPKGKILVSDGWDPKDQRAFGILNGMESEGWPGLFDTNVDDWSGGLNRLAVWAENGADPLFNFVNDKIDPNLKQPPPIRIKRLVWAGTMMSGSALAMNHRPVNEPGVAVSIWDEFVKGTENQLGWLGRATSGPMHLAALTPDIAPEDLRPDGDGLRIERSGDGWQVTPVRPVKEFTVVLRGFRPPGPDLTVAFQAWRGAPEPGVEPAARLVHVKRAGSRMEHAGWLTERPLMLWHYFPDAAEGVTDIEVRLEGPAPVFLRGLAAYAHPDAMARRYERGLVLANPSPRPHTFDLGRIAPGTGYRRLRGSSKQDPETNNGQNVEGAVTLSGKDGLFLTVRDQEKE